MHYRTIVAAVAPVLVGIGAVAALSGPAAATPAASARPAVAGLACGYLGYNGSANDLPRYNHCGRGDIVLKVDHWFWQTTYDCVQPGVHYIDQGSSNFAIIGAEYDGHSCTMPGPVVGP